MNEHIEGLKYHIKINEECIAAIEAKIKEYLSAKNFLMVESLARTATSYQKEIEIFEKLYTALKTENFE